MGARQLIPLWPLAHPKPRANGVSTPPPTVSGCDPLPRLELGCSGISACTPARRGGEPSSSSMQAAAPMDITCPQTCQAVVRLMDETGGCQHATPPSPPRHTTTTHWPQQHTSAGTPATSTDPATARTHAHSPFRGGAQPQLRLHPPPEQPHDERIVRLPVEGRVLLVQLARLGDGGDGR